MQEHPDGALGAAEDARDLRGRQLVDEAQHDGAAAVVGQAADRAPWPPRHRRGGRVGLDVLGIDDRKTRCDRRLQAVAGRRRLVRRSLAITLRAIRNSHTLNVDAPSPSPARARSSNRWQVRERGRRNVRSVASSAA